MKKNQPFSRLDKVNSLILQELNNLLQRDKPESNNSQEEIFISITKVLVSKDLKHAKAYFTVIPAKSRRKAKYFLESRAYDWQKSLGAKIILKYIPRLQYFYDLGQENAMAVEEILNQLEKNGKN